MTKIGSPSRRELVEWLTANCAGRIHVPIWAAHEYLKHTSQERFWPNWRRRPTRSCRWSGAPTVTFDR